MSLFGSRVGQGREPAGLSTALTPTTVQWLISTLGGFRSCGLQCYAARVPAMAKEKHDAPR